LQSGKLVKASLLVRREPQRMVARSMLNCLAEHEITRLLKINGRRGGTIPSNDLNNLLDIRVKFTAKLFWKKMRAK
jgi:hypothetical protein